MAVTLTVNGTPYEYPQNGENPGWGEDATAWAQAVTDVLNNLQGPGDILPTSFTIADNVTTFTNITGLAFSTTSVRSFEIEYNVFRNDGTTPIAESGLIHGVYNGTSWDISRDYTGEAGMTFQITNGGQFQYQSSSVGGTYSGTMKFRARTLGQ